MPGYVSWLVAAGRACSEASRCWGFMPFVVSAAPPTLKPRSFLTLCLCFPAQNTTIRESRDLSTPTLSSVSLVNFPSFFEDTATENHSALTPPMVFKILEKVVAEVFPLDVVADV